MGSLFCKQVYGVTRVLSYLLERGYFVSSTSVDCGPPVAPRDGYLESYTNTTEGSEVFYSCDPGLVPEGKMIALCTENGWSPNPVDRNCTESKLKKIVLF